MWRYRQSTGLLYRDYEYVATGYSGLGAGKNNPKMQDQKGVGPIPEGDWSIDGVYDSAKTGPFTIILVPLSGTDTFNRGGFRIHGDSKSNPGQASHGCIILPRIIRSAIWASNDHLLKVEE